MPPLVSVILPVRNEGRFIGRSLQSVLAQDYPPECLEILVADGMSDDDTREQVESLRLRHRNLSLIDNPGRIVPTGLNAAIARAQGSVIVRVDGHCEIAPDYVRRCVAYLEDGVAEAVGGPLTTIGETWLAQVIAVAMSTPFGVGDSSFRTTSSKTALTDTVAFPAYTRAILERAGPFDEELVRNQDDEYNYRLRRLGARVLLAADVKARYYSRTSLRTLWRQYFQYGYWKVRVMQKHPRQMRPRQFAPVCLVAALVGSAAMAALTPFGLVTFGAVAGSYAAMSLTCSAKAARGWRMFLRLPIVYAVLHFAYGIGFITGLVRFRDRWQRAAPSATWPAVQASARTDSREPQLPAT